MTGRDLVSAALRKLGVLASGETPSASEATDGLSEFNRMIDSWSTEKLLVYAVTAEAPLTLVPGQATYTMGVAGDITSRPVRIDRALIRDGQTDYPVRILSLDEYARIQNKSLQSTYPYGLYDDGGYPQRTITLYPVPNAAKSLILFTDRVLTGLATLDTSVSFPPGYEDACVCNLAVRLSVEYGKAVSEVLAQQAVGSKADIKRANLKPAYLRCDDGVLPQRRMGWSTNDFNNGGYNR